MSGHTYTHTHIHTHRTIKVTLTAHARRGLIMLHTPITHESHPLCGDECENVTHVLWE